MFSRKNEPTWIDLEIERTLKSLRAEIVIGSKEYMQQLVVLERLWAMQDKPAEPLSKDTLANVGANLLGILMIIKHEHVNVIASKAIGLLIRAR